MNFKEKQIERKIPPQESARMVETIYGCKWSLTVYQLLANGINRPGEMVRTRRTKHQSIKSMPEEEHGIWYSEKNGVSRAPASG